MKNRTIYDALSKIMENYNYSVKKEGRRVKLSGSVYIDRIDIDVSHEKTFYIDPKDENSLAKNIKAFKEELTNKVSEIVKDHRDELTDDEAMIDKLLYQIKSLNKELAQTKENLKRANDRIFQLENRNNWLTYPCDNIPRPIEITYSDNTNDIATIDSGKITCNEGQNLTLNDWWADFANVSSSLGINNKNKDIEIG